MEQLQMMLKTQTWPSQCINLLEYNSNYSDTTGSLWFYSKDGANNNHDDIVYGNNFKSFKYKTKLVGKQQLQMGF